MCSSRRSAATISGASTLPATSAADAAGAASAASGCVLSDFLGKWEAERKRREATYLGDEAGVRVPQPVSQDHPRPGQDGDADDCEDSVLEGFWPDERRFESSGVPCEDSSTLFVPSNKRSTRATRRFGSDRFLFVHGGGELPPAFVFLGREWRVLAWKVHEHVTYFAERGPGLEEVRAEGAMDWLVPQALNPEMTLLKYNQRLQLAFSETRRIPDLRLAEVDDLADASGRSCLTDGCGTISPEAAKRVAHLLGLGEVPSAFQGRCGPFKGLWVVDPSMPADGGPDIVARRSQRKWRTSDGGTARLDLEVMCYSRCDLSAVLTSDFIQALESRGVPPETFLELQQEAFDSLRGALADAESFEGFLSLRRRGPKGPMLNAVGSFIDAGMPWTETNFAALRLRILRKHFRLMSKDLRLPVERAARLWMVPDGTRTLPAGRCFVQLRAPGGVCLLGQQVVLLRSPCYHERQLIKLRVSEAVPDGLQDLYDVVVLSAASDREGPSDAERMGGDYDGDHVLLLWDRRLTEAARPDARPFLAEGGGECMPAPGVGEVNPRDLPERTLGLRRQITSTHTKFKALCRLRQDWVESHGFGPEVDELARLCLLGVDCAATGVQIQVPEGLQQGSAQPHWAGRRGRCRDRVLVSTTRACGRLWESSRELPAAAQAGTLLEADHLQMARWTGAQFHDAMERVHGYCCEVQARIKRIRDRPLSANLKRGAEAALKHRFRPATDPRLDAVPGGLLGAAAYAVWAAVRASSLGLPGEQTKAASDALGAYLVCVGAGAPDITLTDPRLVWDLFEPEVLSTVAGAVHGPCQGRVGEELWLDPATDVRFTHAAISDTFRNGGSIVASLRALLLPPEAEGARRKRDFPMVRVRWYRGCYYTLANRRLAIFRLAKFHQPEGRCSLIKVVRVSDQDARAWGWKDKFEAGTTGGRSVQVRSLGWTIGETAEETYADFP